MTIVRIKETGKEVMLALTEPENSYEWASDLICNNSDYQPDEYGIIEMPEEEYTFWADYIHELQDVENKKYKILRKLCDTDLTEAVCYINNACQCEFNDIPAVMQNALDEISERYFK